MTDTNPLPPDDEQDFAALLRTVSADAPSPDAEMLARLRSDSTSLFMKSPPLPNAAAEVLATFASSDTQSQSSSVHRPMIASLFSGATMRIIASLTTVVLAIFGIWFAQNPTHASTLKLGDVLAKLDKANGLQFEVTRDGTTATVWVQPSGMVRWEDSPTTYRIARGSRLWRIDEAGTSASKDVSASRDEQVAGDRTEGDRDETAGARDATFTSIDLTSEENPWFGSDGRIDLIAMLNVGPGNRESLLRAEPVDTKTFAGKSCFVYRRNVPGIHKGELYRLEVFVDRDTEQLVGITARDPNAVDGPPLTEMMLVAFNPQIDDSKFRIPVKLAESDRIGKVTDTQGIVTLRPVGSRRWTPVCRQLLVQPGDWIRTDVRGANAATLELDSKVTLIVGPATLIEMVTPNEARLHAGTVQIARTKLTPNDFKLSGIQANNAITFTEPGKKLVRLDQAEKLTEVKGKPVWLAGYEGASAEDSIGSLIVNVDGREQSLSVGEHHVTVEIRDQIARTTIEETFVNHTDSRLEGQFHFPLPQDASISGFGMWIAGELIEADIVEKQRAREIYETILREKRDPGLLEWTGGNIFKARVFPIEAHSEKRIKIVYTQVLPLRGNRFRYSYALKSELLQTNPLKSLNIRVLLNSAVPLAQVESPTHTCRTQLTKHSAELEFSAQEYTPTRDFEMVCEVDHRENDLLVIPHRRGEDGYFLMQLMPPGADGQWAREIIPDGEPLELLVLCDTSGSMDSSMRQTQEQFVSTLLTSLGEKDRFTLATTDVETQWAFDNFVPSNDANIAKVREFLDSRISLGWTDLDQAFAAVLKKAMPGCQIVYVGDGIVSTVESDAAAFVNRLKALASGGRQSPDTAARSNDADKNRSEQQNRNQGVNTPRSPVFHSVSVGSSYESIVLKGIAALGGGSMRQISGETTPQETALELLNEISQPGLKSVNVEFRGVRVAAVYPEQLPNIAAGTQQILVGRYLPLGNQQSGEVVVTGILNGQPVKYVAKIEMANAEAGNSFIPRLWARGRLDSLLQEGSNQKIQDEIIGLSEEFHIITPYTSLLVLETDADRERFGVKRRFELRDGERFFADGRDNANYELQQEQMQRAGNWRLGLRRQLLAQLVGLGRDANAFSSNPNVLVSQRLRQLEEEYRGRAGGISLSNGRTTLAKDRANVMLGDGRNFGMPVMTWDSDGSEPTEEFESLLAIGGRMSDRNEVSLRLLSTTVSSQPDDVDGLSLREENVSRYSASLDAKNDGAFPFVEFGDSGVSDEFSAATQFEKYSAYSRSRSDSEAKSSLGLDMLSDHQLFAGEEMRGLNAGRGTSLHSALSLAKSESLLGYGFGDSPGGGSGGFAPGGVGGGEYAGRIRQQPNPYQSIQWVDTYFPQLASSPALQNRRPPINGWSPEAVAISESLLREAVLREQPGGIEIQRSTSYWNNSFDRLTAAGQRLELWSTDRWLTRDHGQGQQSIVNWLDKAQRGVSSEAFLLGRSRNSVEQDFATLPFYLSDYSLTPLHQTYRNYRVIIETPGEDRTLLRCSSIDNESNEVRFTIDTKRHVLLKQETLESGNVTSTTTHSDFVEVAGLWWATRIETVSAEHPDRAVHLVTQTIKNHDDASFAASFQTNNSLAVTTIFLTEELPSVRQAKQALAAGTATIQDHFILLLHHSISQKWEDAFEQLRAWEAFADGKPGAAWVRIAVELAASRNEDARQRLVAQTEEIGAATLPQASGPGWNGEDLFLATHTLGLQYGITGWNEYGKVVEILKPVFGRQQDSSVALYDWKTRWLQVLDSQGRAEDALTLQRQMLSDVPGDVSIRTQHAVRLNNLNRPDEALAFLKKQFTTHDWEQSELDNLRFSYADILEGRGRYEEVLAFYEEWLPIATTQSILFQRYLSALVMNDQIDNADAKVLEWLKIAERDGALSSAEIGKVYASVQFCFGSAHNLSRYYGMDRKWLPALYAAARHCIGRDDRAEVTSWIVGNGNFQQSDEGDRLRGDILGILIKAVGKPPVTLKPRDEDSPTASLPLPIPIDRLSVLLEKLAGGRLLVGAGNEMKIRQVANEEWKTIAAALLVWWDATPNDLQKHRLSSLLTTIYARTLNEKHLPFLRRRVAEGPGPHEASYRQELYNAVLNQPWTDEIEAEAFALWPTLVPTELADENGELMPVLDSIRTNQLVPRLCQLIDTMLQKRIAASQQALQDKGDVDAATRTERTKSAAEIVREAREGLASRLQKESDALGSEEEGKPDTLLRQWIIAEKIYLDVLLDRNKGDVINWAWTQLGDAPPKFTPPVEKEGNKVDVDNKLQQTPREQTDEIVTKQLHTLLKQRAWVTLMNLAAGKNASDTLIERILTWIDAGIASGEEATNFANGQLKEQGAEEEEFVDFTIGWRRTKYNALILFDRPDDLVTALKQWIAKDKWNIQWRRALAKLYAEKGELKDAIAQMELVEKDDELTPEDYAAIADWYLVVDQREAYERSRIATYKAMQEWQLGQLLNQRNSEIASGEGPHELDETTLFMLKALFEKASQPANYYGHIHNLYTSTRDFRLLEMIPESLLGQTKESVYASLGNLQSYLIQEVRNEATADEILKHLLKLRDQINAGWVPRGADPNARSLALDLRALDLMESMIERKASEVLNQPGPHGKAALTTFQRAFEQEWQDGERLQYARFLQQIGAVTHERNNPILTPLADEQLRQMRQLYDESKPASNDRVRIGLAHGQLLFNGYGRQQEGLTVLEATLNEFAADHGGLIPFSHNDLVSAYSYMLQKTKQFVAAENYVQKHLDALNSDGERWVYVQHLNGLHQKALYESGRTSLGEDTTLFDNLLARLISQCDTRDDNRRYNVLSMIGNVVDNVIANYTKRIPTAKQKLLTFANQTLQELLAPQQSNYSQLIQHYAGIIHNRIDALEAFSFLLDRFESYPPRFNYGHQDAWQTHAGQLAQFRHESFPLTQPNGGRGDQRARHNALEARLLPIVLSELRSDLTNLRGRNPAIYHITNTYFWAEKAGDFLNVSEDVLKNRKNSPRTITYVAEYVYRGLFQYARAIEVLFIAHRRGLLDDEGQLQLVRYLHEQSRYAESIALLEPIIERRPDEMHLRVLLIRAYYHGQRPEQLATFTAVTDKHFHGGGRWVEGNVIQFARVLSETHQDQRAAECFEEAISLHQYTQPNRGIGSGTLSYYYQEVAAVYSRLGNDEKAVDAAAGGVVSWGNNQNNRQNAISQLESTIASVKNLNAFIKSLDAKASKTGEDSPLLRKMTGKVLQQRGDFAAAIGQYRISLELQRFDRDVHQWMLECFDKLQDQEGATRQLLAQIEFDRHNLSLYKALAERTKSNPQLAERAATSIIEQAPNEAESHQALAEFRQEQNRWQEAIPLWKRVSELRKLEPTGLVGLAKAQIQAKEIAAAKETINQLRRNEWPERFGDIAAQVLELERQIVP